MSTENTHESGVVRPTGRTNRSVALTCLVLSAAVIVLFEITVRLNLVDMPEVGMMAGLVSIFVNAASFALFALLLALKWVVLLVTTTIGVVTGANGIHYAPDDKSRNRAVGYLVAQLALVIGYLYYRYFLFESFVSAA